VERFWQAENRVDIAMRRSSEPDVEVREYSCAKTGRNLLSLPRPFLVNLLVMIAFRLRGEIGGAATSPASDVQVGRVAVAQVPQFALGPPLLHAIHRHRVFGQFGDAGRGIAQRDQLPTVLAGERQRRRRSSALRRRSRLSVILTIDPHQSAA
jgi:hypothetical protein